jgi:predicted SpoU family rRNA methylase
MVGWKYKASLYCKAVSEEIFYKLTNQKQELPIVAMFVTGSERNEQSLYIDASYQVSVYLAKRFQRRRLKCEKLTDDR